MIPFPGGEAGTFAADVPGFLDTSLAAWLDALRSGSEGIAAGSTAAFSLASAAALTGMAARRGAAGETCKERKQWKKEKALDPISDS